jgi:hypothetical protein
MHSIDGIHSFIWCREKKEELGLHRSIVDYISVCKTRLGYEVFIDCKHRSFDIDGYIGGFDGEFKTDGISIVDDKNVVHNIEWDMEKNMEDCTRLEQREKNQITIYYIRRDLLHGPSNRVRTYSDPSFDLFQTLDRLGIV